MKKIILFVLELTLVLTAKVANADYTLGARTGIGPSWHTEASSYSGPSVSTDGLSLYLDADSGYGDPDIWISTRETIHEDWPEPVNLGPLINSSFADGNPDISADGLMLFFNSGRPGGEGGYRDIWFSTRATTNEDWSEPVNLGSPINGPYFDAQPCISADGLTFFFCSDRPGGEGDRDIWFSTRPTTNDNWSEPVNLGPIVNSSSQDLDPDISSDGLKLFFNSERPDGQGGRDIWVTTRATTEDDWDVPVNLGPVVNSPGWEINPCISADGSILYFWSSRPGAWDLYQVQIIPIVDFNGDGNIDTDDLLIMFENWNTDDSTCDIGPMPWGDGVVNKKDVEVWIKYWEQENFPQEDE